MNPVEIANFILSALTVIAQVLTLFLLVSWFLAKKEPQGRCAALLRSITVNRGMILAFTVSLVATLGSLFYSEIAGYEPCKLCWYQRILMYPQVILLGLALFRKETFIRTYSIVLSSLGALIALVHYTGQLGFNIFNLGCLAVGYSANCSQRFVLEFGYITIPMMALSAFLLILVTFLIAQNLDKKNSPA